MWGNFELSCINQCVFKKKLWSFWETISYINNFFSILTDNEKNSEGCVSKIMEKAQEFTLNRNIKRVKIDSQ